jgi:hypothetical protein
VIVRNTGKRAGDRTVLAFLVGADDSRRLAAFTRVHCDPGKQTKHG